MEIKFLKEKKTASLLLGLLVFILSWFEFYIIYPIISSIKSLKFSNIFEGLLLTIKLIFKFIVSNVNMKASYIAMFGFGLLILSLLISALILPILTGISDFLDKIKISKISLYKRRFLKVWGVVLATGLLIIFGTIAMLIIMLPALLITSSCINGKIGYIQCIFFDGITALVILSTFVYIQIPIWNALKNAVSGKREGVTDRKFKELVIAFVIFDLAFVLLRIIMIPLRIKFNGSFSVICQFLLLVFINLIYLAYKLYNIFAILKSDGEASK